MERTKYVILFDHAIRLGTVITKMIGPFDSVDLAREYVAGTKEWKGEVPDGVIETIVVP